VFPFGDNGPTRGGSRQWIASHEEMVVLRAITASSRRRPVASGAWDRGLPR
jgi:hypothetical protein